MLQLLGQHSGPVHTQPLLATQPLEFDSVFSPSPAGDLPLSLTSSPTATWSPFVGGQNSFFPPNCPPAPLSCQMAAPGCDVGATLGGGGSGLCSGGSNTCDSGIMDVSSLEMLLEYVEDQNRLEDQKQQCRLSGEPDVLHSSPPMAPPPPPRPLQSALSFPSAPLRSTAPAAACAEAPKASRSVLAQLLDSASTTTHTPSPTDAIFFPELKHRAELPAPSRQLAGPTQPLPRYSSEVCTPTAASGMRHSLLMPTSCALQQQQQVASAITRVASQAALCSYTSTTAVSQQHSFSARAPQPPSPPQTQTQTALSLAQHSFPAASATALEPTHVPLDDQLQLPLQLGLFSPQNALAASGAPSRALSGSCQQQQQQWLPPPTPTTRAPRFSTSSYASSVSPAPNSVFASDLLEGLCELKPPVSAPPAAQTHALSPDYLPSPPATAVKPAAPEMVVVAAASTETVDVKPVLRRDASIRQRPLSSSSSSTSRSSGTRSPSASEQQPTPTQTPATPQSASMPAPVSEEVRDRLSSTVRQRLLASGRSLVEASAPAPAAPDPEVCIVRS